MGAEQIGHLALSAQETMILVSTTGGVILVAVIGFALWWLRPLRARSIEDQAPDQSEDDGRGAEDR